MTDEPTEDTREEQPRWRFDPGSPPEEWTKEMVGRLTIRWMKRLSEPDNGFLNQAQQASFDEAYREWSREFSERIRPAIEGLMPKISMPDLISPALRASIKQMQSNLAQQLDVSKSLGVRVTNPAWDVETPILKPIRRPALPPATLAYELVEQTSASIEHLTVLQSIADIMQAQATNAARGAVFYVVVGLATTLGGISTLLALQTKNDQLWALGLTLAVAVVALAAFFIRGHRSNQQ